MAKRVKKSGPKAKRGDLVTYNGKQWRVLDRAYYSETEQSYYELSRGRGRNTDYTYVRSDGFSMA